MVIGPMPPWGKCKATAPSRAISLASKNRQGPGLSDGFRRAARITTSAAPQAERASVKAASPHPCQTRYPLTVAACPAPSACQSGCAAASGWVAGSPSFSSQRSTTNPSPRTWLGTRRPASSITPTRRAERAIKMSGHGLWPQIQRATPMGKRKAARPDVDRWMWCCNRHVLRPCFPVAECLNTGPNLAVSL